jgi:uncharacterized protein (TIGR02001 family)
MMKNKATTTVLLSALLTGGLGGAAVAQAQGYEVSGNVTLATDYRFRGISQLDRSPAIQGGLDVEWENGFYLGTWASNVTFSGGAIELDVYGGYAGSINENVDFDIGFLYYGYPEDDADPSLDYWEVYGSVTFFDVTLGLHYSPDYFAETDNFWYVYGAYSYPLMENFALDLHIGWNLFDSDEAFEAFIGPAPGRSPGDNYVDYKAGFTWTVLDLDVGLHYIGTDISNADCFGGTRLCDDSVVLSVSKSL